MWNMCWHENVSDPDELGDVICMDCHQLVQGYVLTLAVLQRFADAVFRDCGSAGRHGSRCVYIENQWVCAEDCPMLRSKS